MSQNSSFKAEKVLLYRENFDGIINKKLLPPIEVNIDPVNACNLKCVWCNANRVLDGKVMSKDQLFNLLRELAQWGVKGICFAGGGEPTLHPDLAEAIKLCTKLGLESSIITNGVNLNNDLIEIIVKNMKWIGISVDAGNREIFEKCKGIDGFEKVTDNIQKLVRAKKKFKSNIGITFKYLIHKLNQYDLIEAYDIAKVIECDSFHLRPVDFLAFQNKEEKLNLDVIQGQIDQIKELNEGSKFEFIPYFVNFDNKLKRKIEFEKCELSPLLGIVMPDGWWVCIDRKGIKKLWMCKIEDVRKFWGSKEHFKLLNKIDPKKECGKCTLNKYYPYFENYRQDLYYYKFV